MSTSVYLGDQGFTTIAVSGQSDITTDQGNDTLTVAAGSNIALTTNAGTDTLTIASNGAANAFTTIAVAGQSDIVADGAADTLTIVASTGIVLTTNATTDTLTIASSASPPFTIANNGIVLKNAGLDTILSVDGNGNPKLQGYDGPDPIGAITFSVGGSPRLLYSATDGFNFQAEAITAIGAGTDIDMYLYPKGNGILATDHPFTTTSGGIAASYTTALGVPNADLVWTDTSVGQAGNSIQIAYVDPGLANQSLSATYAAPVLTIHLATNAGSVITTTANAIIALGAYGGAPVGVPTATGDGTGVVTALSATNLSGGLSALNVTGPAYLSSIVPDSDGFSFNGTASATDQFYTFNNLSQTALAGVALEISTHGNAGTGNAATYLTVHAGGSNEAGFNYTVAGDSGNATPNTSFNFPGAALFAGASSYSFSNDVLLANGKALHTDTTDAHAYKFQVYDVNGTALRDWMVATNGDAPSVVLSIPTTGTLSIQASTYKSSDGTTGATAGPFTTVTAIQAKNGLITTLTGA